MGHNVVLQSNYYLVYPGGLNLVLFWKNRDIKLLKSFNPTDPRLFWVPTFFLTAICKGYPTYPKDPSIKLFEIPMGGPLDHIGDTKG